MPKTPRKPQPRDTFLEAISPDELRGAKLITEPITMTKLRRMVEKLEKPEDGYSLAAIVCYDDDEEQWYVFSLSVKGSSLVGRSLLYAIPGVGRMTPFVTKRQTPKGYRTLETLIRQINDIFGDRSRLSVLFNLERHVDLKDRFLYPEDEES